MTDSAYKAKERLLLLVGDEGETSALKKIRGEFPLI